jgi:cytochrome P450
MILQTAHYFASPLGFSDLCARKYGDRIRIRIYGFGESILLSHPDDVKGVFLADGDTLHAGEANGILRPILGDHSVLLLDGPPHMRQRRLLLPPFHGERMRAYADTMREVTLRRVAGWPIGEPFPIHREMQAITLEVILRTVFGVDEAERLAHVERLVSELVASVSAPHALIAGAFPPLHPLMTQIKLAKEAVDAALYDEIRRRRSASDLEARSDILSMLILARDEAGAALTDVELRDELMTLLAAGHETSATSLAWTFSRVLRDARVECCLREEIDRAPVDLEYTDATIKEALRLHPVIIEVGRRVKRPFSLNGTDIPIGVFLIPSIHLIHRRPDLYPNPEVFRPERFIGAKIDPYAWLPFGGGIRRCLGMAFALFEMRIVLSAVLSAVRLELASYAHPRPTWHSITIAPGGGVPVRVKSRRHSGHNHKTSAVVTRAPAPA